MNCKPETNEADDTIKYDPKEHYVIDGFAKQDKQCVIVLPCPMMNGFPFLGIKSTVLVIEDRPIKPEDIPAKVEEAEGEDLNEAEGEGTQQIEGEIEDAESNLNKSHSVKLTNNHSESQSSLQTDPENEECEAEIECSFAAATEAKDPVALWKSYLNRPEEDRPIYYQPDNTFEYNKLGGHDRDYDQSRNYDDTRSYDQNLFRPQEQRRSSYADKYLKNGNQDSNYVQLSTKPIEPFNKSPVREELSTPSFPNFNKKYTNSNNMGPNDLKSEYNPRTTSRQPYCSSVISPRNDVSPVSIFYIISYKHYRVIKRSGLTLEPHLTGMTKVVAGTVNVTGQPLDMRRTRGLIQGHLVAI